MRGGGTVTG